MSKVVYYCIVKDCPWQMTFSHQVLYDPDLNVPEWTDKETSASLNAWHQKVETGVTSHMNSHATVEFMATINHLSAQLVTLQIRLRKMAKEREAHVCNPGELP